MIKIKKYRIFQFLMCLFIKYNIMRISTVRVVIWQQMLSPTLPFLSLFLSFLPSCYLLLITISAFHSLLSFFPPILPLHCLTSYSYLYHSIIILYYQSNLQSNGIKRWKLNEKEICILNIKKFSFLILFLYFYFCLWVSTAVWDCSFCT